MLLIKQNNPLQVHETEINEWAELPPEAFKWNEDRFQLAQNMEFKIVMTLFGNQF